MDTNLIVPKNGKKMLLFLEDTEFLKEMNFLDALAKHKLETYIYVNIDRVSAEELSPFIPFSLNDVSSILTKQLVGTHLLVFGSPTFIQEVKEKSYLAGFSENEIQSVVLGQKEEKVFCVKCYSLNIKQQAEEIHCSHCETTLQISNHFSKRLNAYLGYIKVG